MRFLLPPLLSQPPDVPWPAQDWPVAEPPSGIDRDGLAYLLDTAFAEPQPVTTSTTNDLLIVHRGRIVAERYANGVTAADTQPSWSMAKSILHAAIGVLVRDGRLDVAERAPIRQWQQSGDPRAAITIDSLLHMTSGLGFCEDYVDGEASDVIKMLFRPGADDMGAFAAAFPLDHEPDTFFNYSSGTTNILSSIVRDLLGGKEAYASFLQSDLFGPIGMTSAAPRFDKSGSWIGSSYCFATPRDFARFGLLYLRDGAWGGKRLLPEGWVDYGRRPGPVWPINENYGYGAHWWLLGDELGTFFAQGYLGQYIFLTPALDLIIVRHGETPAERCPCIVEQSRRIIDIFRAGTLQ
jgi:CubicO group peptidase (beta-lactamase class C family)